MIIFIYNIIFFIFLFFIYDLLYTVKYKVVKPVHLSYMILTFIILGIIPNFVQNSLIQILDICLILLFLIKVVFSFLFLSKKTFLKYKKTVFILFCLMILLISSSVYYKVILNNYFINVSNDDIESIIFENEYNIIYFGRPTCQECQITEPILRKIANKFKSTVYYYNTDYARKLDEIKMKEITKKYGIEMVPTIIYTKNGYVISMINELSSENIIVDFEGLVSK